MLFALRITKMPIRVDFKHKLIRSMSEKLKKIQNITFI